MNHFVYTVQGDKPADAISLRQPCLSLRLMRAVRFLLDGRPRHSVISVTAGDDFRHYTVKDPKLLKTLQIDAHPLVSRSYKFQRTPGLLCNL